MILWTQHDGGEVRSAMADSPGRGDVEAIVTSHNILEHEWPPALASAIRRVIVWSGWVEGEHGAMRTWSPDAWKRLLAWGDTAGRWAHANGIRIWLRPHARHIVSDAPRCVAIARELAERPIDIVLDPAAMLTPEMFPLAGEHIARIIASLAGHERVAGIIIANGDHTAGAVDGALSLVPPDRGRLDPREIARAVREHWPWEKPIILLGDDVARRRALFEG